MFRRLVLLCLVLVFATFAQAELVSAQQVEGGYGENDLGLGPPPQEQEVDIDDILNPDPDKTVVENNLDVLFPPSGPDTLDPVFPPPGDGNAPSSEPPGILESAWNWIQEQIRLPFVN